MTKERRPKPIALDAYEALAERFAALIDTKAYRAGKKLTPEQARCEIRYAVKYDPIVYGVETPSFEETWARFGPAIEEHGFGHYSKVVSALSARTASGRQGGAGHAARGPQGRARVLHS